MKLLSVFVMLLVFAIAGSSKPDIDVQPTATVSPKSALQLEFKKRLEIPPILYKGVAEPVYNVVWSPDAKKLAVTYETEVYIWIYDAVTGTTLTKVTNSNTTVYDSTLAWSPNSRYLAGAFKGHNTVRIWEINNNSSKILTTINLEGIHCDYSLSWYVDESKLSEPCWSPELNTNAGYIWDTKTGKKLLENADLFPSTWSPDGKKIVAATEYIDRYSLRRDTLQIRDGATFSPGFIFPDQDSSIYLIGSWSSNSRYFVGGYLSGTEKLWVWDTATNSVIKGFKDGEVVWWPFVGGVNPLETLVWIAGESGAEFWSFKDKTFLGALKEPDGVPGFIKVVGEPNGHLFAASTADGYIQIWQVDLVETDSF